MNPTDRVRELAAELADRLLPDCHCHCGCDQNGPDSQEGQGHADLPFEHWCPNAKSIAAALAQARAEGARRQPTPDVTALAAEIEDRLSRARPREWLAERLAGVIAGSREEGVSRAADEVQMLALQIEGRVLRIDQEDGADFTATATAYDLRRRAELLRKVERDLRKLTAAPPAEPAAVDVERCMKCGVEQPVACRRGPARRPGQGGR